MSLHTRIAALCAQWGFRQGHVFSNPHDWPAAYTPLDVVILPFILHQMEEGDSFLRAIGKAAPHLVVVDYRQPERNLDFPAFWFFTLLEGRHAPYRAFIQRGGIEGALRAVGRFPQYREPVRGGAASLILC